MRKIMIVIEDTPQHQGVVAFNVYMAGDKERIGRIPLNELTPGEYWAGRLFEVCVGELRRAGVIKTETENVNLKEGHH